MWQAACNHRPIPAPLQHRHKAILGRFLVGVPSLFATLNPNSPSPPHRRKAVLEPHHLRSPAQLIAITRTVVLAAAVSGVAAVDSYIQCCVLVLLYGCERRGGGGGCAGQPPRVGGILPGAADLPGCTGSQQATNTGFRLPLRLCQSTPFTCGACAPTTWRCSAGLSWRRRWPRCARWASAWPSWTGAAPAT